MLVQRFNALHCVNAALWPNLPPNGLCKAVKETYLSLLLLQQRPNCFAQWKEFVWCAVSAHVLYPGITYTCLCNASPLGYNQSPRLAHSLEFAVYTAPVPLAWKSIDLTGAYGRLQTSVNDSKALGWWWSSYHNSPLVYCNILIIIKVAVNICAPSHVSFSLSRMQKNLHDN